MPEAYGRRGPRMEEFTAPAANSGRRRAGTRPALVARLAKVRLKEAWS